MSEIDINIYEDKKMIHLEYEPCVPVSLSVECTEDYVNFDFRTTNEYNFNGTLCPPSSVLNQINIPISFEATKSSLVMMDCSELILKFVGNKPIQDDYNMSHTLDNHKFEDFDSYNTEDFNDFDDCDSDINIENPAVFDIEVKLGYIKPFIQLGQLYGHLGSEILREKSKGVMNKRDGIIVRNNISSNTVLSEFTDNNDKYILEKYIKIDSDEGVKINRKKYNAWIGIKSTHSTGYFTGSTQQISSSSYTPAFGLNPDKFNLKELDNTLELSVKRGSKDNRRDMRKVESFGTLKGEIYQNYSKKMLPHQMTNF